MTQTFPTVARDAIAIPVASRRAVPWAFLARLRYQVLGAALVCVVAPALVRAGFDIKWQVGSLENTLAGTLAAVVGGAFILRRIGGYPGVWSLSLVLPSFLMSFLIAVMVFFFARIEYSRSQFLVSFALTIVWFFIAVSVERKVRRPRFLILPFGRTEHLPENRDADWIVAPMDLPDSEAREAPMTRVRLADGTSGVVADLHADLPPAWESFVADCALRGIPVYHAKQVAESLTGRVEIEHLSENNFGSLLPSSVYARVKRGLDLLGVLGTALPVGLISLVAAIAIKLDDGGPVFFRQQRMGFRGKPFSILKFRTMSVGAADKGHFTTAEDPRITRVGRFLRRYRIDELPQIVNILRGEMSWIGPRPEALPLSTWYGGQIPFYSYRHIVRPGITGWAQVNQGNVAEIEAATGKLHYDFFYIKNFSPWLDLLVAARTVAIVFTGFGAR